MNNTVADSPNKLLEINDDELVAILNGTDDLSLVKCKALWFFGEWSALVNFELKNLNNHPDRDKVSVLIASAYLQLGDLEKSRALTKLAIKWGCPHDSIAKVFIAGVHNTLGRVSALKRDDKRINVHFKNSVAILDAKNASLVAKVRAVKEMSNLGLLSETVGILRDEVNALDSKTKRHTTIENDIFQLHQVISSIHEMNSLKDHSIRAVDGSLDAEIKHITWMHQSHQDIINVINEFMNSTADGQDYRIRRLCQLFENIEIVAIQYYEISYIDLDLVAQLDELILTNFSSDDFETLSNKVMNKLLIKELLFIRISELIMLNFLKCSDFDQFLKIYNEIVQVNKFDRDVSQNCTISIWFLQNANYVDVFAVLDEITDTSKLLGLLNSNEIKKHIRVALYFLLANYYMSKNNKIKATHYFSLALKYAQSNVYIIECCINELVKLKQSTHSISLLVEELLESSNLSLKEQSSLLSAFELSAKNITNASGHGHFLLLEFVRNQFEYIRANSVAKKMVMIEIGTTRELLGSQGSTEKLARYCNEKGIHFITVDMDPVNTDLAHDLLNLINPSFEAVNAKGEDYLATYKDEIDFIFLDAYDFDHGQHSIERQTRYESVLGSKINDSDCHQMHLECVTSLTKKLSQHGVICFDDVWFKNGVWQGKGTTAMPYLLKNNFKVVASSDNAAILLREIF